MWYLLFSIFVIFGSAAYSKQCSKYDWCDCELIKDTEVTVEIVTLTINNNPILHFRFEAFSAISFCLVVAACVFKAGGFCVQWWETSGRSSFPLFWNGANKNLLFFAVLRWVSLCQNLSLATQWSQKDLFPSKLQSHWDWRCVLTAYLRTAGGANGS